MGSLLIQEEIMRYLNHRLAHEWADFSVDVRSAAVLVMANNVAVAHAASSTPEIRKLIEQLHSLSGSGQSTVFAAPRLRMPVEKAALINGLSMCTHELDEGYRKAVCHAGLYILPALLAVAEQDGHSVEEVLRTLVLTYDLVARVALAWQFPQLKFHPHGLLAPVGAAMAFAFLKRWSAESMLKLLGAACSVGMVSPFPLAPRGMMIRNGWAGLGAVSGLQTALLVQCDLDADAQAVSDTCEVLGGTFERSYFDVACNPEWSILDGYHKIFACCQYAHSAIEACLELLEKQGGTLSIDQIERIQVDIHPQGLLLHNSNPETTLAAKFSVPHAVAATLFYQHAGIDAFGTQSLQCAEVAALRKKIHLTSFKPLKPAPLDRPAKVSLTFIDGKTTSVTCLSARGGPDRPLTDKDIWLKIEAITAKDFKGLSQIMADLQTVNQIPTYVGNHLMSWSIGQFLDQAYQQ